MKPLSTDKLAAFEPTVVLDCGYQPAIHNVAHLPEVAKEHAYHYRTELAVA
jgi:hypothetical protein